MCIRDRYIAQVYKYQASQDKECSHHRIRYFRKNQWICKEGRSKSGPPWPGGLLSSVDYLLFWNSVLACAIWQVNANICTMDAIDISTHCKWVLYQKGTEMRTLKPLRNERVGHSVSLWFGALLITTINLYSILTMSLGTRRLFNRNAVIRHAL